MAKSWSLLPVALLFAGLLSPARAEQPRYGIQATWSLPQEDLKTLTGSGNGLGLGLFMDITLQAGEVLRPRLDVIQYPSHTFSDLVDIEHRKWACRSLGVDYLHYSEGKNEGFYLALGLAINNYSESVDLNGETNSSQATRLGLSAGLGYRVDKHWEANLRYTRSVLSNAGWDASITVAALNLGLAYSF